MELQKPLPAWLEDNRSAAKTVELPDGEVRLPAAENFLEAATLFFGKKPGHAHVCASRDEAELLYRIAKEGVRGPVSIPAGERECKALSRQLETHLAEGRRALMRLAEERAGTEKLREQVLETLYRWFIDGKPTQPATSAHTATAQGA